MAPVNRCPKIIPGATVSKMVQDGLTSEEILRSLEENHSIKVSQRTPTRQKEDWGLTHNATQQANHLEETIQKYFDKGLNQAMQTFDNIWLATPSSNLSKTISAQALDLQLLKSSSNQS
ncbi:hypothetical protein PCASD_25678 [Puccinia coronata f. sp. avenae]|uniref:Uncharacterized protein n=2 Tax=Puccinia coronata f. sp. avenae TaxID=200324 RepID=A0A2N5S4E9_9BASI|nr:hypothetical protein PCASD_25678 [Puccinia coronata f. sp. avenae]